MAENDDTKGSTIYAEATRLRIRGRSKMTISELEAAVATAKASGVDLQKEDEAKAAAKARPKERDRFGDEVPDPEEELTQGDWRRIVTSSSVSLQKILQAEGLKACQRQAIEKVLWDRAEREEERRKAAELRGPMAYYRITKGGRYVTRDGHVTRLRAGGMVTEGSHDLNTLRAQGIEFEPSGGAVKVVDQFGRDTFHHQPLQNPPEVPEPPPVAELDGPQETPEGPAEEQPAEAEVEP